MTTTATTSNASSAPIELEKATSKLLDSYMKSTPTKLKLIDAYLVFVMLSGIIQFLYCVLVSSFPYNGFLAGFGSCVGSFVLAANLRIQLNADNAKEFEGIGHERAFADYVFCSVLLHCLVVNFMG